MSAANALVHRLSLGKLGNEACKKTTATTKKLRKNSKVLKKNENSPKWKLRVHSFGAILAIFIPV